MTTTPLWVPLGAAFIAVLGTLAGVIFTQVWNSRLEERRWVRESNRLREAEAKEDANRTYEHRRAAYVDFLQELERVERVISDPNRVPAEKRTLNNPSPSDLTELWSAVRIYGTYEADNKASECIGFLDHWGNQPDDDMLADNFYSARAGYLLQIRKDLGILERKPEEKPSSRG